MGPAGIATVPIPIAGAAIIGIGGMDIGGPAAPLGICGAVSIGEAPDRTAIGPYLAMTSPIFP